MNVLFCREPRHAEPIARCDQSLRNLGVNVEAVECTTLGRVLRSLLQSDCDLLLTTTSLMGEELADVGCPILMIEPSAVPDLGCQLEQARHWLPLTNGVIKGYLYANRRLYNQRRGNSSCHELSAAGVTGRNSLAIMGVPLPQLSRVDLEKLYLGYGAGASGRIRDALIVPWLYNDTRQWDVHYVCTTSYCGTEIETHRQHAFEVARKYAPAICAEGRPMGRPEYLRSMTNSKAVLSPYGWTEECLRDYEAMACGAVVIKPPMEHITCEPNIYEPDETFLQCRADLTDVPDIIEMVNADWEEYLPMRKRCRALAEDAYSSTAIAEQLTNVFKEVLT